MKIREVLLTIMVMLEEEKNTRKNEKKKSRLDNELDDFSQVNLLNPQNSNVNNIIPTLQVRKLKVREFKCPQFISGIIHIEIEI